VLVREFRDGRVGRRIRPDPPASGGDNWEGPLFIPARNGVETARRPPSRSGVPAGGGGGGGGGGGVGGQEPLTMHPLLLQRVLRSAASRRTLPTGSRSRDAEEPDLARCTINGELPTNPVALPATRVGRDPREDQHRAPTAVSTDCPRHARWASSSCRTCRLDLRARLPASVRDPKTTIGP